MPDKPKNRRRSFGAHLLALAKTTLAGVVLLALIGLVGFFALSVSRRYRTPEAALAHYPQPREKPERWYEPEAKPAVISDFKVTQRQTLEDMDAVLLVFTWQEDLTWKCVGSLLLREFNDIFGGWEALRQSHGGCSSGDAGGGSASFDVWQSPWWDLPRYYYFAYIGTTPDFGRIEFVLSDGSRHSAAPVDDTVALVTRSLAPFQLEAQRYLDDDGELIYEAPGW